ncbi:peptide MFS transporter [Novosphingobium rosa]|uniref:peptide MFS transporter n=1 Tax=Novosphingobium rosa TaxID=76978 RepID=UPI0008360A25|nr:peptide MFS transporter [Novosphingobium rosa]
MRDASNAAPRQWMGHPVQLARLFSIEMWERFGFYGMRALLTLYLTKHFVLGDHASTGIYGGYTALVYLTPLAGGLVADQFLGSKRSVKFGALVMAAGYFALAFGGAAAKPWVEFDGARHDVVIEHFHDGPTSGAQERRVVIVNGSPEQIRGNDDGNIDLLAGDGQVARHLASGTLKEGAQREGWRVALMLMALSAVAVGNGFFKPNISTMVGALYEQGDRRRDAGFTIFYMGINLGSMIGQTVAPWLADAYGWPAGFGSAGAVMLLAWGMLRFDGGRLAGYGETPQREGGDRAWTIYALAVLAIPLFYLLFVNLMDTPEPVAGAGLAGYLLGLPLMGKFLCGTFAVALPAILIWSWRVGSRIEFQMMVAAMVLITFNTVFWSLFEQAGSSLTLFADRNTDRTIWGSLSMSAPQTQQFNSVAIVVLAPVMGALWGWMGRRGWEPSIPVKFALGLIGVGAGFLFLVLGAQFAGPSFKVGLIWLAGLYVIHSIAELCLSPVGLSMITKLAIPRVVGLMMGTWYLSMALGEYGAGLLAQLATVKTVGGEVTNLKLSLETYIATYRQIGWSSVGVGVVLLAIAPLLKRLMHGVR